MITPIEIQNKTFKSGGLGYDKKDVDGFIREILESYEALYRDKMEMSDRLNTLNEGLQYYKQIEKTLQKALMLAEKTAEDTRNTAMERARLIEQEAQAKAGDILADAKRQLEKIRKQTMLLVRQYDMNKAKFKSLLDAEAEVLNSQSFSIRLEELSMFENISDSVEIPTGSFYEAADQSLPENPLDKTMDDSSELEFINLDE